MRPKDSFRTAWQIKSFKPTAIAIEIRIGQDFFPLVTNRPVMDKTAGTIQDLVSVKKIMNASSIRLCKC